MGEIVAGVQRSVKALILKLVSSTWNFSLHLNNFKVRWWVPRMFTKAQNGKEWNCIAYLQFCSFKSKYSEWKQGSPFWFCNQPTKHQISPFSKKYVGQLKARMMMVSVHGFMKDYCLFMIFQKVIELVQSIYQSCDKFNWCCLAEKKENNPKREFQCYRKIFPFTYLKLQELLSPAVPLKFQLNLIITTSCFQNMQD